MLTDEARKAIERRSLEIAAEIEAKSGPYRAELRGAAAWYLIETAAGAERKAVRFMVDRGIGVFLPEFFGEAMRMRLGGKSVDIGGDRLIFPRHVFVYLWGLEANLRQVLACPGVKGFVMRGDRLFVVPGDLIDYLQALQFATVPRRSRRAARRTRHQSDNNAQPDDLMIKISVRSVWSVVAAGNDEARVAGFRKAMGLAL